MNKKTMLLGALLTFASPLTLAQVGYVGVSFGSVNLDDSDASLDATVTNLQVEIGGSINDNLDIEARVSIGVGDDDLTLGGDTVDIEQKLGLGIIFKPFIDLNDNFSLYGVFGYSELDFELTGPGGSADADASGFTLGVGLDLQINKDLSLGVEANTFDDDGTDFQTVSVGLTKHF